MRIHILRSLQNLVDTPATHRSIDVRFKQILLEINWKRKKRSSRCLRRKICAAKLPVRKIRRLWTSKKIKKQKRLMMIFPLRNKSSKLRTKNPLARQKSKRLTGQQRNSMAYPIDFLLAPRGTTQITLLAS